VCVGDQGRRGACVGDQGRRVGDQERVIERGVCVGDDQGSGVCG
jgi:hypothetical protein